MTTNNDTIGKTTPQFANKLEHFIFNLTHAWDAGYSDTQQENGHSCWVRNNEQWALEQADILRALRNVAERRITLKEAMDDVYTWGRNQALRDLGL